MVGMLQIMTYLLCVYLIFKGIDILQIALMSNRENRSSGIIIGIIMIVVSLIAAAFFVNMIDTQAKSISDGMRGFKQIEAQTGKVESMLKDCCGFKIAWQERRLALGIEIVMSDPGKYFAHMKASTSGMAWNVRFGWWG